MRGQPVRCKVIYNGIDFAAKVEESRVVGYVRVLDEEVRAEPLDDPGNILLTQLQVAKRPLQAPPHITSGSARRVDLFN